MVIHIAEAVAVYIVLALLMALLGRRRRLGAWGYFFASILLTPVIGLLLVLASDPRPRLRTIDAQRLAELERIAASRGRAVLPPPGRS